MKSVMRYLKMAKSRLRYHKTGKTLELFADTDWAGNIMNRKSYSGYVVILAGEAVTWSTRNKVPRHCQRWSQTWSPCAPITRLLISCVKVGAGEFTVSPKVVMWQSRSYRVSREANVVWMQLAHQFAILFLEGLGKEKNQGIFNT